MIGVAIALLLLFANPLIDKLPVRPARIHQGVIA